MFWHSPHPQIYRIFAINLLSLVSQLNRVAVWLFSVHSQFAIEKKKGMVPCFVSDKSDMLSRDIANKERNAFSWLTI